MPELPFKFGAASAQLPFGLACGQRGLNFITLRLKRGQQLFAGEATRMAYMTDEAAEGRDAFLEKRDPDWKRFPWYY